ncbi:phospholipase [Halostella sp. JP-L12]|uniref:phospholipase D-like domain-containing protein n=1 Tax=Halostella TaxID=1843185 RepID=UPI000EF78230|nr:MULTISPECIES: phospholipase D-like domain-containing protein [Halostella]NHN49537.1 phospholipase [Halostella sp. JP-L12]
MLSRAFVVLVLVALAVPASGGAVPAASVPVRATEDPRIVAVYPDPVEADDRGEFVVVDFPEPTDLSGWTIADGETVAPLPNRTVEGRVAVSADPAAARNLTDTPVLPLDGRLELANGGETIELRRGNATVDAATYERSREGERLTRDGWVPMGASDHDPAVSGPADVEAFALPDSPGVPVQALSGADDRILLAGYTLSSERAVRELERAAARGVEVRVLVDDSPVGGTSERQVAALNRLAESDATVRVAGGERERYRFHHPKYAVVDGRALVMTENWKPSGTGGGSSRGWGALVRDAAVADDLAAVFRGDWNARDAVPWREHRETVDPVSGNASRESYPERFAPRNVSVERVRLLTAPDNAEAGIVREIRDAEESLLVEQVSLGGRETPPVRATVDAARRGVRVRVLLSGAWYAREENRERVRWLNALAEREGLDLEARVAEPRSRFEKIHAKGVVIDERRVILGSVNWNNNSLRENREVALVLVGDEVGAYYARLFRADWRGGAWRVPGGVAAVLGLVVLAATWYGRRKIEFE